MVCHVMSSCLRDEISNKEMKPFKKACTSPGIKRRLTSFTSNELHRFSRVYARVNINIAIRMGESQFSDFDADGYGGLASVRFTFNPGRL